MTPELSLWFGVSDFNDWKWARTLQNCCKLHLLRIQHLKMIRFRPERLSLMDKTDSFASIRGEGLKWKKNIEMQSMKSFEHRSSLLHGIRPFIYRSYQLRSLLVPFLYFNWLFVYQGSSFFSSWNNHNYNFIYFLTWYFYRNRSLNLLVDLSYEITGGRIHTSDFLTRLFF